MDDNTKEVIELGLSIFLFLGVLWIFTRLL